MCKPPSLSNPRGHAGKRGSSVHEGFAMIGMVSPRRAVPALKPSGIANREVLCAHSVYSRSRGDGGAMLLSTTIEEEESEGEEACLPMPPADERDPQKSPLSLSCSGISLACEANQPGSRPSTTEPERATSLAASAVASVASGCSKLLRRLLHHEHHCSHPGQHNLASTDRPAANTPSTTPTAPCSSASPRSFQAATRSLSASATEQRHGCCARHIRSPAPSPFAAAAGNPTTSYSSSTLPTRGVVARSATPHHLLYPTCTRAGTPQAQPAPQQPHLVQLMDGDDVALAMHALQLAAEVHDRLWDSRRCAAGGLAAGDLAQWDADVAAAEPLYEEATASARAIQHRALHSLVREAVQRYVNPQRGSPDDVLHVVLELLTGCGGAAAAATVTAEGRWQAPQRSGSTGGAGGGVTAAAPRGGRTRATHAMLCHSSRGGGGSGGNAGQHSGSGGLEGSLSGRSSGGGSGGGSSTSSGRRLLRAFGIRG